jgi:hypothetical protein
MIRILILVLATAASAQTVDEIIAKHLAARGGAEKFAAIRTMRTEGRIKFGEGEFSPITVLAKRPSKFYVSFKLGQDTIEQRYDGATAWSGATVATGASKNQILDQAGSAIGGPLLDGKARGNKITFAGKEKWKNLDTLKLKVTLPITGTQMAIYLDSKTYLEVGEELFVKLNGADAVIEETVSEDKRFDGLLFPTLFLSHVVGQQASQRLEIQKMAINPPIADSAFRPPAKPPVQKPKAN